MNVQRSSCLILYFILVTHSLYNKLSATNIPYFIIFKLFKRMHKGSNDSICCNVVLFSYFQCLQIIFRDDFSCLQEMSKYGLSLLIILPHCPSVAFKTVSQFRKPEHVGVFMFRFQMQFHCNVLHDENYLQCDIVRERKLSALSEACHTSKEAITRT